MTAYVFFFNRETFEAARAARRAGGVTPISYVTSERRRPMTEMRRGDELFIVGLSDNRVMLAGRLIVESQPIPRDEAERRLGRRDLRAGDLYLLAQPGTIDEFRPDLPVPGEIARQLELFTTNGAPVKTGSLREGRPDPNLFLSNPQLSANAADRLRALLELPEASHQGSLNSPSAEVEFSESSAPAGEDDDEYRMRAIKTRRGQPEFRRRLLEAYGTRCMITNCRVNALLEAAHITSHAFHTDYRLSNGLLLRADIHTLFDMDLIGIDANYRIRISEQIRHSEYGGYDGRRLDRLPPRMADAPDREALQRRIKRLK